MGLEDKDIVALSGAHTLVINLHRSEPIFNKFFQNQLMYSTDVFFDWFDVVGRGT